ncbi:MarR family winged helix-turn-helix transcriptional regulator [Humibacter ginsenosidimutans]|nr:MarR family transcriptional regulator [Humibacter ginsenosidimutans]
MGFLLKHAYLAYESLAAEKYDAIGATARECGVLAQVQATENPSQLELANELGVDRTTMAQLLDSLEQRGLVSRTPLPTDRRKNLVSLTKSGHDLLARDRVIRAELDREFLAPVHTAEQATLRSSLHAIVNTQRTSSRTP